MHRARNLKELIRKEGNNNSATVRVTLLNKSEDGFQREIYGDYIQWDAQLVKSVTIWNSGSIHCDKRFRSTHFDEITTGNRVW